jgi:potassium-dependent mechanosensitive channel
LQIASQHPDVLTDPAPEVVIAELGDSTLNFLLRFWRVIGPEDNYRIKSDLYHSILEVFAEQKIEMPFPQRDLHVRSVSAPILIATTPAAGKS